MSFEHELPAEQLIPLHVGSTFEFIKHREMGLLDFHRALGGRAILQHEEIPKKRLGTRPESIRCIKRDCFPSPEPGRAPHFSWCGKPLYSFYKAFLSIDHAAFNGEQEGRMVTCPEFCAAVAEALSNGHP